jgi:exopolyphosphatase/pppGpp-phosphohydrolase
MDLVFAAIDIGSNSTNLLIIDQSGQTLERIVRSTRLVNATNPRMLERIRVANQTT